jgi:small conductance mechanosensitive channel
VEIEQPPSIRFSGISGYVQISLDHHALGEIMTENGVRPIEEEGKLRIGLIGVTVIIAGVFAVLTIILYTLQTVLGLPIPYPNITITITWALIALVGVWILGHTIQTTTSPLIGSASAGTIRKIVTTLLLFVILFATLGRLGIDLSAYLVSLGVTAIVVGFAAQTTIGNLIAGMLVLVSKPFRRGDYVRVNITGAPIEGRLEEISFLRSRIVTNDGISISVPNTVMLAVPISNFTVFEKRPIILNVTLDKSVSIDAFRSKIETAQISDNEEKSERRLYVKGFDSESTAIELWVQVSTKNFLRERSLIVHKLQEFCEHENIPLKKIELQS